MLTAGPPLLERVLGHGPNDPFPYAVGPDLRPFGPLARVPDVNNYVEGLPPEETTVFVLGADGPLGRDLFLRLLAGGLVSVQVALGATLLALLIGVVVGSVAAWWGGWVDGVLSRLTEFVMAFPFILVMIAIGSRSDAFLDPYTVGGLLQPGTLSLIVLIGAFTWFYPARIVRTQVLGIRRREFVEASRMVGAGDWRILRTGVLPHLLPTLVAYGTLMLAANILLEAGISFLGVGIEAPTSSWGNLLAANWGSLLSVVPQPPQPAPPLPTIAPSAAIFATVLAFNLVGEGLREAADPQGTR